jgi:hypothetical protein
MSKLVETPFGMSLALPQRAQISALSQVFSPEFACGSFEFICKNKIRANFLSNLVDVLAAAATASATAKQHKPTPVNHLDEILAVQPYKSTTENKNDTSD